MDVERFIDLNCDLGEGMKNDAQLMAFISSCSIACGGHFGTKQSIRNTIQLARKHDVKVGAHPSYPDKEHFGRRRLEIGSSELYESISTQISHFMDVCSEEGIQINHIKLHGAVYNVAARDESTASTIAQVLRDLNVTVPVFTPHNSVLARLVASSNSVIPEGFIDRNYQEDGSLVSRKEVNALIESPDLAWKQLKQLYFKQEITVTNGEIIPFIAKTYCLHGDAVNAVKIAEHIGTRLREHNIRLDKNA